MLEIISENLYGVPYSFVEMWCILSIVLFLSGAIIFCMIAIIVTLLQNICDKIKNKRVNQENNISKNDYIGIIDIDDYDDLDIFNTNGEP